MADDTRVDVQSIPLDLIDPPATPLRTVADQEKFDDLVASIRQWGVLEPLGVRPKDGRYEIVYGHLRYLAARAVGLLTVPCVIRTEQGADLALLTLEENAARQEHSPLDEARLYRHLIDTYGMTVEEIAHKRGVTTTTIYQRLALLRAPQDVQEALHNRQITLSHALAIMQLQDPQKRDYYLRQVTEFGASAHVVRSWVQRELVAEGLRPTPVPVGGVNPTEVVRPGGTALCNLCDEAYPPEQTVGVFLCLQDFRLFQKFKEAYRAKDTERVEGV